MRYAPIDPTLFVANRRRLAERPRPGLAVLNCRRQDGHAGHGRLQQTDVMPTSAMAPTPSSSRRTCSTSPESTRRRAPWSFPPGPGRRSTARCSSCAKPTIRSRSGRARSTRARRRPPCPACRRCAGTPSSTRCSGAWSRRPSGSTSTRTSTRGPPRRSRAGTRASAGAAARASRCTATNGWRRSCTTCAPSNRPWRSTSSGRRPRSRAGPSGACSGSSARGSGSSRSRPRSGTSSCGGARAARPSRPSRPPAPTAAPCTT